MRFHACLVLVCVLNVFFLFVYFTLLNSHLHLHPPLIPLSDKINYFRIRLKLLFLTILISIISSNRKHVTKSKHLSSLMRGTFVYLSAVSGSSAIHLHSQCSLDFSVVFGVLSWKLNKFIVFLHVFLIKWIPFWMYAQSCPLTDGTVYTHWPNISVHPNKNDSCTYRYFSLRVLNWLSKPGFIYTTETAFVSLSLSALTHWF